MNDTYGHLIGDICLKAIAKNLQVNLNHQNDTASRFGGEEFVILLPDTSIENALVVANRLINTVATHEVTYQEIHLTLTISVGIAAITPDKHNTQDDLLEKADKALYKAKEEGRNCVRTHTT